MDLIAHFAALAQTRNPLWIDGAAYVRRVLTKDRGLPWEDTAAFVALVRKQQQLLQSDALTLDLGDYYQAVIAAQPALVQAMGARPRPNYALKTLLEDAPSLARLSEVVSAVAQIKGDTPLVIGCPSPKLWIQTAFQTVQPGGQAVFGWEEAEKAAVYVAGFLRTFSQAGVDGVLIVDRPTEGPRNAQELAAYAPLLNVADHYRWTVGLDQRDADCSFADSTLGFVIHNRPVEGRCFGAIVDEHLWSGDDEHALPTANFYYTEIPANAAPDFVLSRLQYARVRT